MNVHDMPFTGINRSTKSVRCWILEVAPVDSSGGPHHRDLWCSTLFRVALSFTHHISNI